MKSHTEVSPSDLRSVKLTINPRTYSSLEQIIDLLDDKTQRKINSIQAVVYIYEIPSWFPQDLILQRLRSTRGLVDWRFIYEPKRNRFRGVFFFQYKEQAHQALHMNISVKAKHKSLKTEMKSLELDLLELIGSYITKLRLPMMKSPFINRPEVKKKSIIRYMFGRQHTQSKGLDYIQKADKNM